MPLRGRLRQLVAAAIVAGSVAGGVLFLLQHAMVVPLIEQAEAYEHSSGSGHDDTASHEWTPSDGAERTTYTLIGTILTGIAFAAIAFGAAAAFGWPLTPARGLVLGVIGFACFVIAPGLGVRPKPPGVPGADVAAAQAWWTLASVSTIAGFATIAGADRRRWRWGAAVVLWTLPHLVGAPQVVETTLVPPDLVNRFAFVSIVTRLPFWLLLGLTGGLLLKDSCGPAGRSALW